MADITLKSSRPEIDPKQLTVIFVMKRPSAVWRKRPEVAQEVPLGRSFPVVVRSKTLSAYNQLTNDESHLLGP